VTVTAAQARLRPAMDPRRYLGSAWRHPVFRAVAKAVLTVWAATTLTFFLIRLMPGSPVDIKIDELINTSNGGLTYEEARTIASSLFAIDLSAPLHEQYLSFMGNVIHGDLGRSFLSQSTPVLSIILSVLPWTLFAVGTGLLLSFVAGVGLGLVAAYRRNSVFDHVVSSGASILTSVPNFLTALLIVLIFGVQLGLLPIANMRGAYTPGVEVGFNLVFILDVLFHAMLPIFVFFLTNLGHWVLSMRSATLAALDEDYVTAARARGLTDGRITTAYVGRNAVLPLVTQFAIAAGYVVGGAVIIERIFVYQGVGLRLLAAVNQRDYPVMQGIVLLTTAAVVTANVVADLLYTRLDPRIGRAGGSGG
jgi:peptide/nickel transport system permease protein